MVSGHHRLTRPVLRDDASESRLCTLTCTGVIADAVFTVCRPSSPGSAALLRSTLDPLPGSSVAPGGAILLGLAVRCGVAGGGLGVVALLVSSETVVPCPAAALRRIRSGNGPEMRCAYRKQIWPVRHSTAATCPGACLA